MPLEHGPYLKVAAFCESVIEGKDGVLSLIRVIDRLTTTAQGPAVSEGMPPLPYQMKAVLMLTSGRATGSQEVRLVVEDPSGIRKDLWTGTVHLEGTDRGQNLIMNFAMEFKLEGLYWFDVYIGEEMLTRMPFRIIYTRLSHGLPGQ